MVIKYGILGYAAVKKLSISIHFIKNYILSTMEEVLNTSHP